MTHSLIILSLHVQPPSGWIWSPGHLVYRLIISRLALRRCLHSCHMQHVVAVKDAGEGSCSPHPRAGAPRRSVTDRTRRLTGPLGDLREASLFSGFSEVFPLATRGVWPWRSYLQPPGLLCTSRPFAAQHFHHVSVITERGVCHVCNLHT